MRNLLTLNLLKFPALLMAMILGTTAYAGSQIIPQSLVDLWQSHAPLCTPPNQVAFPAKELCDDGDMTLFNGLLCAADGSASSAGCQAVKQSLGADGKWFRSPLLLQKAQEICAAGTDNPLYATYCVNMFSPDMALGAQLYLTTTHDLPSLVSWFSWMDKNRPCLVGSGDQCLKGWPRFCTDDDKNGCSLRPGDLAILAETLNYFHQSDMGSWFNGLLNTFRGRAVDNILTDSRVNGAGYSQHLVGVEIFLLQLQGHTDPKLKAAATSLHLSQPQNPFFAYLAGENNERVKDLVLAECPQSEAQISAHKFQWAWERADAEQAWKNSMLWDCLFMSKLLNK